MRTDQAADPKRWLILGAMALMMFIATIDNTVMTVGLSSIQSGLGESNAQLQWSMDAYTLTFAALLFTAGILGDRFGRRRVLLAGLVIFLGASLAGAWASSPAELIGWRAVMGVGASVVPGCTMAVIASVFPDGERARAIGYWSMSAGIGIAAGPVVGGALLSAFWWGTLLLVNVPFAVVALAMVGVLVPANRGSGAPRVDVTGVLLSVGGVGALVYGVIEGGEENSWLEGVVLGPVLLGLVLLAVMVRAARRRDRPAFDPSLFGDRRFAIGAAALAASFFVATGATYILSFYLQQLRNFTPVQAGLLTLPLAVGSTVSGAAATRLIARWGPAVALGGSGLLMAACCVFYAVVDATTPVWAFEAVHALFGLGFGATFAVGMAATMSAVRPAKAGAGSAVANTVRHLGTAFGVAVLGSVLGSVYRHSLGGAAGGLPAGARTSLGGTLRAVVHAPPGVRGAVVADADSAFLTGLHAAMWVAAVVCAAASAVVLTGLRGGPVPARPVGGHRPRAVAGETR
ncbi:MFS transporter [Streptomyces sp. NPDC029006]|uniref:MFS transporter n=1 Tax=Streptomyces sp. NPDC029006 TaxID=3155467 RepID=UPI0033C59DE8